MGETMNCLTCFGMSSVQNSLQELLCLKSEQDEIVILPFLFGIVSVRLG